MSSAEHILNEKWYYSIEVEKGVFTDGKKHQNFALTRNLMANVDISSQDCLDIGTQEAVVPILLSKRNPRLMIAYDRFKLDHKIDYLKSIYNVDFMYIGGLELDRLPDHLSGMGQKYFDFVVFSGVMYHMINPFGHLILVSSFCKKGGLFLIETAAIQDAEHKLMFNANATLYGKWANYFLPTTAWLDYALRMVGLRPLYAGYTATSGKTEPRRVAVLCRREASPCPLDSDDDWVFNAPHKRVFKSEAGLDWDKIKTTHSDIEFKTYDQRFIRLGDKDLYSALEQNPPFKIDPNDLQLRLKDTV